MGQGKNIKNILITDKFISRFYLIAFFMLCNSLLFGFLFRSVGFSFWRQAIWLAGIYLFYTIIKQQPLVQFKFKRNP
jgi:hypothetical protein